MQRKQDLMQRSVDIMKQKLQKTSEKAYHFKRETSIINWLLKAVETNFILDAGNIIENYEKLKVEHE